MLQKIYDIYDEPFFPQTRLEKHKITLKDWGDEKTYSANLNKIKDKISEYDFKQEFLNKLKKLFQIIHPTPNEENKGKLIDSGNSSFYQTVLPENTAQSLEATRSDQIPPLTLIEQQDAIKIIPSSNIKKDETSTKHNPSSICSLTLCSFLRGP